MHSCSTDNSVRPFVRPLCSAIISKQLNTSSEFLHHTVAQSIYTGSFMSIKHLHEIPTGHPLRGRLIQVGCKNFAVFDQQLAISRKHYKIAPCHSYHGTLVRDLSNGTIFNDIEWPLSQFKVTKLLDALNVLCAQLTRALFAIVKFLVDYRVHYSIAYHIVWNAESETYLAASTSVSP